MAEKTNSEVAKSINEVTNIIQELRTIHECHFNEELLFAFRGECKDYGQTSLQPSIFRKYKYVKNENTYLS